MKFPLGAVGNGVKNLLTTMNFVVMINGIPFGFQSVSEMEDNQDYTYINEGGRNDYPIRLRVPQTTPHKLVFKRGFRISPMTDVVNFGLDILGRQVIKRSGLGMILILDMNQEIKAIYGFISQGAVEWSLGDLDAQGNSVLIESFTITHRGLHFIPVV